MRTPLEFSLLKEFAKIVQLTNLLQQLRVTDLLVTFDNASIKGISFTFKKHPVHK